MADIKLTYFNAQGMAEISRLILACANQKFTDERMEREDWPAVKPTVPYGQIPILLYNGVVISQSITIARFLANEFGLAGKNNLEKAEADEIVDALMDIQNARYGVFFNKDPEQKDQLLEEFKVKANTILTHLESRLKSRGGQYFAGNQLTWADLQLFNILDALKVLIPAPVEDLPLLKDLEDRVADIPNVKKWIETRPKQQ
ncbi:glutathione S-transferase 1 [Eurytemora carolleeae]|uniref:glutathione S-transferase 1 n=1 Tax=Eurytemora carolleeae TaxID=1294199 RepID=UPI000C78BDE0|nr:glutathione S-transferase 1 [Eurytemora carolleeae]|eukprot:XP_023338893.1 glutathione S-transferase 1-like [Eurytemora affinis]